VLLIILAVVWAVYLVSWARSRTEHRSVNSISTFNKHLSVLERTAPGRGSAPTRIAGSPAPARGSVSLARPAFAPTSMRSASGVAMSRQQARERRKNVLFALAGGALVTLALTVLLGGPFVYLFALSGLLLVGYIALLAQTQRVAVERQSKVRYLQQPVDYADYREPAPFFLQSSAN